MLSTEIISFYSQKHTKQLNRQAAESFFNDKVGGTYSYTFKGQLQQ
jgi:hypothetical protein